MSLFKQTFSVSSVSLSILSDKSHFLMTSSSRKWHHLGGKATAQPSTVLEMNSVMWYWVEETLTWAHTARHDPPGPSVPVKVSLMSRNQKVLILFLPAPRESQKTDGVSESCWERMKVSLHAAERRFTRRTRRSHLLCAN